MQPINLIINHNPVPWTAPRIGKGICYSKHSHVQEAFRWFILEQYKYPPFEGYVRLEFAFYFPYPKSASKKKIELMQEGKIYPTRSDLTNLQKFCEDCLKKIVIEDDRKVVEILSKKFYSFTGYILIKVIPCE